MARGRKAIPKAIREAVIKKHEPKCFYCGKEGFVSTRFGKPTVLEKEFTKRWINEFDGTYTLVHRSMQFDHVIPLIRGGETTVENLVICCYFCNAGKRDAICGRWKNVKASSRAK